MGYRKDVCVTQEVPLYLYYGKKSPLTTTEYPKYSYKTGKLRYVWIQPCKRLVSYWSGKVNQIDFSEAKGGRNLVPPVLLPPCTHNSVSDDTPLTLDLPTRIQARQIYVWR